MGKSRLQIWQLWLPAWIYAGIIFFLSWRDVHMSMEQWIGLIVALLTIAGTLIATFWQLKRDGKTIDGISSDTTQVKSDVQHIEKMSEQQSLDLRNLVSDLEHRKRMEAQFPKSVSGQELMEAGSNRLLEENAVLKHEYEDLQRKFGESLDKVNELTAENSRLRGEITHLQAALRKERTVSKDAPCEDVELEI